MENRKDTAATPVEQNDYSRVAREHAPHLAFGVGAGTGALAALKMKGRYGNAASLALPVLGGTAGFLGTRAALGQENDLKTTSTLSMLGGGAAAVGIHDKLMANRKFNPLRRNVVGSLGGLGGAMASVAMHNRKKNEAQQNNPAQAAVPKYPRQA